MKPVHGYAKQGAAFGYTRQRGLHSRIVTASRPNAAPMVVASRLRKGPAGSGKGAARLIAEAVGAVRAMGAAAEIIVRADSAFGRRPVVAR
nr:hypothetical protein [Streptomyces hygroscopicus]